MNKKALAFIANGTEEGELINVVDILCRAGVDVELVSIDGCTVESSHGITLTADLSINSVGLDGVDLLFIPGGMPGSKHLGECAPLVELIKTALGKNIRVAAICAAPSLVLGKNGFLKGKRGICFPGFEDGMDGCEIVKGARVVTDGLITTARGLGCAIDLGLELVSLLCGTDKAQEVKSKIQY